jgi:sporulation protein YlmC with PRC-barrel domain
MTITTENIDAMQGANVLDANGDKIGSLDEIYVDDRTGQPEWAAVKTGLFGNHLSFVPLSGSRQEGDDLRVRYEKDTVKDAPRIDPDGHLSEQDEAELYRYYDMDAELAGDETSGGCGSHPDAAPSGQAHQARQPDHERHRRWSQPQVIRKHHAAPRRRPVELACLGVVGWWRGAPMGSAVAWG